MEQPNIIALVLHNHY